MKLKYLILVFLLLGCDDKSDIQESALKVKRSHQKELAGGLERLMQSLGMVDVQSLDSTIVINLVYSDTNNFLHEDVYGSLQHCFLNQETAHKLMKADSILHHEFPNYRFLIYDGARPHRIQVKMYDLYKKMPVAQGLYLSHPDFHSVHNYGAAVDLTLADKMGHPLDMGTPVDHFGVEAHIVDEWFLVQSGKITEEAFNNRKLLRRIMRDAGFTPIQYEWWHFNSCSREYAQKYYTFIP